MATYAIGDIQGCMTSLEHLLDAVQFSPEKDHIIIVGDLVNRGPSSLQALRWAKGHARSITMVLGNHDLALLAVREGLRPIRPRDTFDAILAANDCDSLLRWLSERPLAAMVQGHLVVHAGVMPHWSVEQTMQHAKDAQQMLQGSERRVLLGGLQQHSKGDAALDPRVQAARVLTYLRALNRNLQPDFHFRGPIKALADGHFAWFAAPARQTAQTPILCGHWAALGRYVGHNIRALDTGCVWGGRLTAVRLQDGAFIDVPYAESAPPLSADTD